MTSRAAVRYEVFRNRSLDERLEVVSVTDSAGGSRLDTARLFYDPVRSFIYVENLPTPVGINDEIEIRNPITGEVVHFGRVTQSWPQITPQGERIAIISQLQPYHLGYPSLGQWVYNPSEDRYFETDLDLVFNPVVDGQVRGNLNDTIVSPRNALPMFLDSEATRTAAARQLQGADSIPWYLSGIIYYLCWSLNVPQQYVLNPTLQELQAAFRDNDEQVSGIRIRRGAYLAEALDQILPPLGYNWRIERLGLGARKLRFYHRVIAGPLKSIKLQPRLQTLDLEKTDTIQEGVRFDLSRMANIVRVRGGFGQFEITNELAKAWPTSQDNLADDDLAKTSETFQNNANAYRKWVLNEAGDYIGLRPEITELYYDGLLAKLRGIIVDPDSNRTLAEVLPARRRSLLPTLTLADDDAPIGNVRGVMIEYSNPLFGQSGEPEWLPIGNWGCELLEKEAGVYFDAVRVPEQILSQGSSARLRATFVLRVDDQMFGQADHQGGSPNIDDIALVLNMPETFRFAQVTTLSQYSGSGKPTLESDNVAEALKFARHVRDNWDLMDVSGPVTIEGLDNDYQVGDRITGIANRNVSFEARTNSGAYPQITRIERDVATQRTTLHLQRYRNPVRPPEP